MAKTLSDEQRAKLRENMAKARAARANKKKKELISKERVVPEKETEEGTWVGGHRLDKEPVG